MYKNFNITESEKEQILNNHKSHGYRQPLNEQSISTQIPYPSGVKPIKKPTSTKKPVDNVDTNFNFIHQTQIDVNDPKFGKNINQSDKLIGKKATLYANPQDAMAAYQSGKSNPQSQGSIIVKFISIEYSDNDRLIIKVIPDSSKTNYSNSTVINILHFNRVNGTFILAEEKKVYYSESVKNILNDYFSTELASNNKANQSNMAEEISRIKGMMGINESFDDFDSEIQPEEMSDFDNMSVNDFNEDMVPDGIETLRSLKDKVKNGAKVFVDGKEVFKMPVLNLVTFVGGGKTGLPRDGEELNSIKDLIIVDGAPLEMLYKEKPKPIVYTDRRTPEQKEKEQRDWNDRYGPGGGYQTSAGFYTGD